MKRALLSIPALALLVLAAKGAAVPGGPIGTLEQGRYTCELPGDAAAAAGLHVPEADFTVISASSYRADGRLGSYLLTGDRLVMTNGPHRGQRFQRQSRGFLRQVDAMGNEGKLRCVLGRRYNTDPQRCPDTPAQEGPSLHVPQADASNGKRQAHCSAAGSSRRAG